ncbi:NAD-dependent deacylase [uncultured Paracoccus sp.]|uniref:NAD-dependent deacylase n=1 Tax=uncultured Paracoccus sp. TaxID=189685 RepID=UPI002627B2A4|nr:NAD-dependent deacylase [uncultured Paracoccus sp.]
MGIVVLTGAGLSAESGLATFRDGDGLWERHAVEDVATPAAFRRDPALVHRFYNARRRQAAGAQPNAAHAALARLSNRADVTLITQNVDDLLERAGARDVVHMHGALNRAICAACGHGWPASGDMAASEPCPACGTPACRPDIVWFGEMPQHMDRIMQALADATLFAAIGTSGQVYPAAGFVEIASGCGAACVELNLDPQRTSPLFERHIVGPASQTVPAWVDEILG